MDIKVIFDPNKLIVAVSSHKSGHRRKPTLENAVRSYNSNIKRHRKASFVKMIFTSCTYFCPGTVFSTKLTAVEIIGILRNFQPFQQVFQHFLTLNVDF